VYWPDEAIALLKTNTVADLSLDHDLGDDLRGTGYDVLLWIEEAVALADFKPPRITIHSANPAARLRMDAAVRSINARRSLEVAEGLKMVGAKHSYFDIPIDPILQHMVDTYPRLFHGSTPRSYSFVQPGWRSLVDDLCRRLDGMLTEEQARMFTVRQIKDKLGTLRFYFWFGPAFEAPPTEEDSKGMLEVGFGVGVDRNVEAAEKIRAAIEEAISRSSATYSVCGQPGGMHRLDGLLSVRCVDHSSVR
jgi:hypothetical protein